MRCKPHVARTDSNTRCSNQASRSEHSAWAYGHDWFRNHIWWRDRLCRERVTSSGDRLDRALQCADFVWLRRNDDSILDQATEYATRDRATTADAIDVCRKISAVIATSSANGASR
jgi:hypothetical protein